MSNSKASIPTHSATLFSERGYCTIDNVASMRQLQTLEAGLNEVEKYIQIKGLPSGSYINYAEKDKKIINSLHRLNEIENPLLTTFVHETGLACIASSLLDSEVILFSMQAFLKPAGYGLQTPPHQDNAYWCHEGIGGITIWLAIDDAGPQNGMMKYLISENDKLLEHHLSTNTPGSSLVIPWEILEDKEWYQPTLKAGSVAVHHGLVVHYSEANSSEVPRRGFLVNYRSINCNRNEEEYSTYLSQLEKIYGR
jgi:phytanoyl-CoA hydroxylase